MIASFTQNFIFIKTRKTSGTSAEIVMSAWCSGNDICTPISSEDEADRDEMGGRPMNYRRFGIQRFYNHMPANEVKKKLPHLWDKAFKFSVDRHPYEKVVSLAAFRLGRKGAYGSDALNEEVDRTIVRGEYLNADLYMINGEIALDEVIRYEDFWPWLHEFAAKNGLPIDSVPRAKSRFGSDNSVYRSFKLSRAQKDAIRNHAANEFDIFQWGER